MSDKAVARLLLREACRVAAWFLFYLAAGSLGSMVLAEVSGRMARIDEQVRVWFWGSACFYGWWRLK